MASSQLTDCGQGCGQQRPLWALAMQVALCRLVPDLTAWDWSRRIWPTQEPTASG